MALDFEKFAISAIKIIDELRSTDSDPKNLDDNNSAEPVESRINTFYRAIGLPSFRDNKRPLNDKDKLNEGNAFGKKGDKFSKFPELKKRDENFNTKLDEDQLNTFLDTSKATFLSSIKKAGENDARLKGTLFPMVVDGDIKVYPQSKRIAGAFFKKDSQLIHGKATYRRPLIELIVLLRLREEGFANSDDTKKLQASFDDLDENFFDGLGENNITLEIRFSLVNAVTDPKGIKKFVDALVKRLGKIRTNNSRANFDSSVESAPNEHQVRRVTFGISTEEEKIKRKREDLARENDAKLVILEFDDSLGGEATRNMKDALFAPMILDLVSTENEEIDKITKEAEHKNKLSEKELRILHKRADLSLGTFSGLSGIDIVVVITALFSISMEDLLGLLNQDNIDRLNTLKSTTVFSSKKNNNDLEGDDGSVTKLENKVKEIYKDLSDKIEIIDHELTEKEDSDKP